MSICDGPAIGNVFYVSIVLVVAIVFLVYGWVMGEINQSMKDK